MRSYVYPKRKLRNEEVSGSIPLSSTNLRRFRGFGWQATGPRRTRQAVANSSPTSFLSAPSRTKRVIDAMSGAK